MKSLFWFILGFVIASAGLGIADHYGNRISTYQPIGLVYPKIMTYIDPDIDPGFNPYHSTETIKAKFCTCDMGKLEARIKQLEDNQIIISTGPVTPYKLNWGDMTLIRSEQSK